MIRDPSDGSVREPTKEEPSKSRPPTTGNIPAMPDTGIRQPTRIDAQERLEKWRKWLKDYHAKKEAAHAGGKDERTAGDVQDRAGG